jgi:outer membrane protein OmpA-like peptidoglycan-associated protein
MMDEQADWALPLAVVAAVVALTLAGVLGLAVAEADPTPAATATLAAEAGAPDVDATGTDALLGFAAGSARLPDDAAALLGPLADEARAAPAAQRVVVQAGHDGSPAGVALAGQRAQAVLHALQAHGVSRQRLLLADPAPPGASAAVGPQQVQAALR